MLGRNRLGEMTTATPIIPSARPHEELIRR
jgi:hypothetical protein